MTISFSNLPPPQRSAATARPDGPADKPITLGTTAGLLRNPGGFYRNGFKRLLDITAIIVAAPVVVPMVAVMAVMVAKSGGKPFYGQVRVGRGGKPFLM